MLWACRLGSEGELHPMGVTASYRQPTKMHFHPTGWSCLYPYTADLLCLESACPSVRTTTPQLGWELAVLCHLSCPELAIPRCSVVPRRTYLDVLWIDLPTWAVATEPRQMGMGLGHVLAAAPVHHSGAFSGKRDTSTGHRRKSTQREDSSMSDISTYSRLSIRFTRRTGFAHCSVGSLLAPL